MHASAWIGGTTWRPIKDDLNQPHRLFRTRRTGPRAARAGKGRDQGQGSVDKERKTSWRREHQRPVSGDRQLRAADARLLSARKGAVRPAQPCRIRWRVILVTGGLMQRRFSIFVRRDCSLFGVAPILPRRHGRVEIRSEALAESSRSRSRIRVFMCGGPGCERLRSRSRRRVLANWKNGVVANPPARVPRYELSWYARCHQGGTCRSTQPFLAYVVVYARDPSSGYGFVYLPGKGEPSYDVNVRSISRGPHVEGHWFRTTESWDRFVDPLIARSPARPILALKAPPSCRFLPASCSGELIRCYW